MFTRSKHSKVDDVCKKETFLQRMKGGVVASMLDYDNVVSEFELESRYHVNFMKCIWKGYWNPPSIPPPEPWVRY